MSQPKESRDPLWREEFSVRSQDERYVGRRQFGKFLVLTSFAMAAGNAWIFVKSLLSKHVTHPAVPVGKLSEVPVGGVKLFRYPGPEDPCILVRTSESEVAAFSQKCTHLSCAVYFAKENGRLECPCHEGYFSAKDGRVLQGPPQRPLPRVVLKREGDQLVAVGMDSGHQES